eukprot:TRINITY_DN774336_c0_g1_i1.p1 TRINITY_DN774336_c0_g1~~TRINITY_DN774336_c0_g1_i1.p1  ORF type:complete len:223 (-),score=82.35 TRINITY_DN774336_c0_g1_i1:237-905(-)
MEATKEQIIEAFKFRRAIKSYDTKKKISKEDFEFILETGRLSPSSCGLEPWKFLVVQNPELRAKLKPNCWGAQFGQMDTASHFVLFLARSAKDMTPGCEYFKTHYAETHGFPAEVIDTYNGLIKNFQENCFDLSDDRKIFDWASKQVYIAMGNMMSTAAQIGISSCPIEGFERSKIEDILVEEGVLDKEHFGVAVMCSFGYKDAEAKHPQTRRPLDNIAEFC